MTTLLALVFAPANVSGASGPTAEQTNVDLYYYGGSGIGVSWTNTDGAAATQIGRSTSESEPAGVEAEVGAGVGSYETDTMGDIVLDPTQPGAARWWVRAKKNGQTTDWVKAVGAVENEEAYSDSGGTGSGGGGTGGEEFQ